MKNSKNWEMVSLISVPSISEYVEEVVISVVVGDKLQDKLLGNPEDDFAKANQCSMYGLFRQLSYVAQFSCILFQEITHV